MCSSTILPKYGKYPLEVHQMFRDRLTRTRVSKTEGVWSPWSSWSTCSRSCGGGVTQQTRYCVPKPPESSPGRGHRRRRQEKAGKHCVGLYKRYHICNTQDCSTGRDFRAEQCAAYNKNSFKGRHYFWEPFLLGPDECALNCKAVGMGFYATLNKTVIDGTICMKPLTATGKTAPPGTRGVCVDARCKSVGANGVIGAVDEAPESCAACLKGTCKSISIIYTRADLPHGYSLVAQIPAGACNIIVQQLKHTKNYMALRNANTSSFIINGEWKFSPSRSIDAAGTRFTYTKQDTSLETITAAGPLNTPVDVMIVYFQPNPGIKYGYSLPINTPAGEQIAPPFMKRPPVDSHLEPRRLEPSLNSVTQRDEAKPIHRRRIRRRFAWKITGVTPCSKTCGGGIQTTVITCVREHLQTVVPEKRCVNLERPPPQQVRCNTQACPPIWGGVWGPCTGSCDKGVQHFILQCQQETTSGRTLVVSDVACVQPKPISSSRPCSLPACDSTSDNELFRHPPSDSHVKNDYVEWKVGPWSQCSVSCGTGQRTRSVTCPSGRCRPEERPTHAEYCDSGTCASPGSSSLWLVSEWSQCSEECGTGIQTRSTSCAKDNCEKPTKPETSRGCSSDRHCTGKWFTGPWGSCSDSCNGQARQKRDVFCIVKVRGHPHVTNEMTCSMSEKPYDEQACHGECVPKWFVGEWGLCEGNCPNGVQRREVKCLDANDNFSGACSNEEKPMVKRPCACQKRDDQQNKPVQDEPVSSGCVDKFANCYLAVQARLCQYPYYTSNCCVSCRKA